MTIEEGVAFFEEDKEYYEKAIISTPNKRIEAYKMAIVALNFWKDVKNGHFIIYRAARGSGKTDLKGIGYTKEQIEEAFNDVVNFNSFLMNIINEKYKDYLGGVNNDTRTDTAIQGDRQK